MNDTKHTYYERRAGERAKPGIHCYGSNENFCVIVPTGIKPEQKSYVPVRRGEGEEWVLESSNEAVRVTGQVFSLPRSGWSLSCRNVKQRTLSDQTRVPTRSKS